MSAFEDFDERELESIAAIDDERVSAP